MNKAKIEQAAKEFCEAEYIDGKNWISLQSSGHHLRIDAVLSKFLQSLLDSGRVMTDDDYKRFRDEYKAEINTDALSCAVAEVEEQHDLSMSILKSDNEVMQELIDLQRKRISQLEQQPLSSAGKEVQQPDNNVALIDAVNNFCEQEDLNPKQVVFDNTGLCMYSIRKILVKFNNQFKSTPSKEISDQEIEEAGYSDNGDISNHRFNSADEIEPWIEGAKWYKKRMS